MTWERSGVWEHVFRTGGVSLRTHGSDHIIELRPVNNPKNVQEMIRDFITVLAT